MGYIARGIVSNEKRDPDIRRGFGVRWIRIIGRQR